MSDVTPCSVLNQELGSTAVTQTYEVRAQEADLSSPDSV